MQDEDRGVVRGDSGPCVLDLVPRSNTLTETHERIGAGSSMLPSTDLYFTHGPQCVATGGFKSARLMSSI